MAEAISAINERHGKPGEMEGTEPPATSISKIAGNVMPAQGHARDRGNGVLADREPDTSPRSEKRGGDLRSSFLAAVGDTISQTVRRIPFRFHPSQVGSAVRACVFGSYTQTRTELNATHG